MIMLALLISASLAINYINHWSVLLLYMHVLCMMNLAYTDGLEIKKVSHDIFNSRHVIKVALHFQKQKNFYMFTQISK